MVADHTVELWTDSDCVNAPQVRAWLLDCLRQADPTWDLVEHTDAGVASPTLVIAGKDVAGGTGLDTAGAESCRLDLPARAAIRAALDLPECHDDH
jgi:hypothetical protein